jgi:AraC family transcriptional regulator
MKKDDKHTSPDFLVQSSNKSAQFLEDISVHATPSASGSKVRRPLASLHTGTTHVEVSELVWREPTTLTVTPSRPGFTLVVSGSSSQIEYGYVNESASFGKLGLILFLLPGKELRARIPPGMVSTVTCSFERDYAENIVGSFADFPQSKLLDSLDVKSALISSILMRLRSEALYPGPLSNALVESLGHAILLECANWLLTDTSPAQTEGRLTARHFALVEEYLSSLSNKAPSVPEIAAICGLSERYFAKLFREQTGSTVAQYIQSAQIAKAKSLLLETELPLKAIAFRLGFSTPSNFSAAFRAATGCTPGQFRKAE